MSCKILLIEDDPSFANAVKIMMEPYPVVVEWAETAKLGIQAYQKNIHYWATVIIDYCLPDLTGSEVAQHLKRINPDQDLLFASGFDNPDYLIDFLETGGATSFLRKGLPAQSIAQKILASVKAYRHRNRLIGSLEHNPSEVERTLGSMGFIGRSSQMLAVAEMVKLYRTSSYPVMIMGETGTGKELVARALVPEGKKLIAINCARYIQSEDKLEAELFGHVKGAFTGAVKDQQGLAQAAHGQVLFLDELHELTRSAQAKLLRFLQEMKFRRVGDSSGTEYAANFRLVAATKPDIYQKIQAGEFMGDLFHRVAQLKIKVPSLNERPQDIEPLALHFQNEFNKGRPLNQQKQIRLSTLNEMSKHHWSGNVRDLQNALKQMLTNCKSDIVNPSEFETYLKGSNEGVADTKFMGSLSETIEDFEKSEVLRALQSSFTLTETALKLSISRFALNRKLKRLQIKAEMYLREPIHT